MQLSFNLLSSIVTVVWFVAFLGLCIWAWSARRSKDFTAAARQPLENDGIETAPDGHGSS
jgi:hypothetical protein